MKALFYLILLGFIIFLNIGLYLPSLLAVDEEDIGKNIKRLKKHQWFKQLLDNEAYKQFIIHDRDVRDLIGKFKTNKIDNRFTQNRYRKRLEKTLKQKLSHLSS